MKQKASVLFTSFKIHKRSCHDYDLFSVDLLVV